MKQQKHSFHAQIQKNVSLNYLFYLPKDYHDTSDKTWPLIMFLHGMGERGEDIELVKKHGIPKVIEKKDDFPFVVISPQCPQYSVWPGQIDALHALLAEIIQKYHIDTSRIYLTGLSMGGFGTWHFAEVYPHLFAAVVPICGGTLPHIGFPERIRVLKDTPVWAFHGAKDETVALSMSQELVDVLKANNGNVKFTIYPEAGHDSWTETYDNPELYEWLLEQKNDNFQKNFP
jgi:predicted peptidase